MSACPRSGLVRPLARLRDLPSHWTRGTPQLYQVFSGAHETEPPSPTSPQIGKRNDLNFPAGARADAMWLTESMDHRGLRNCPVRLAVAAYRPAATGRLQHRASPRTDIWKLRSCFYADTRADAMWLTESMDHRGLLSCLVRLAVTAHRSAGQARSQDRAGSLAPLKIR